MKIKLPKDKQFFSNLILQRTDAFIKCGGSKILQKVFEDGGNTEILINFLLIINYGIIFKNRLYS